MPTQLRQRVIFVCLGLILAHSMPTFSAEQNVSGTWAVTIETPKTGLRNTTLTLEQDGEKLSGHIVGSNGRDEAITGTVVAGQIQFSYTTNSIRVRTESGDKPLTLNYSGTANENEIDVKAPSPLGETTLKAKRK